MPMQTTAVMKRLGTILLLLGPVTTLAVSPYSSFDPINLIKMIFVSGFAFSALFLIISTWKVSFIRLPRGVWFATWFFLLWMTIVLATSGAPLNQQFWGVFGRNNGYLGYFSLIVLLIAVALIQNKSFYHKLVNAIVLTAVPTTVYALIQVAGRDPISWSVMEPFATLGNINFSSAFFGLASLCATVLVFAPKQKIWIRVALLIMVVTDLYIILETGSIQGFMIYLAGMGIIGFFLVRSYKPTRFLQIPYLALGVVGFALTSLALNNVGPLARFVFGDTILFRFDYWYAGWAMTIKNPIFGVGLDSYGDWYRELRGEIATLRTVPDRITNTAHNIYLDISASGGLPLILAYLVLLGYAFRAAWRVIQRDKSFNTYFVALFATWIAYLIQAAISINQIGVGIWGWLFTGALIGYEIATREVSQSSTKVQSPSKGKSRIDSTQLPASVALLGIAGFVFGFFLSFIPFNADSNFRDAIQAGNPAEQLTKAKALGATAFHMELALDAAVKANNEALADQITEELLNRYPRDFMAWRVKQVLASSTPEERDEAYQRLKAMDPFNPDIQRVD
jgi:O-antigen ligase